MSDTTTDDHADRGLSRPGRRAHLAGQRPRPLPRRAAAADGDLRRQRARRLRRLRRHDQRRARHHRPHRRLPHHAGEGRPRRARARRSWATSAPTRAATPTHHPWADRLPRDADARPGPPRRRHAPRGLPLSDRGLDRRRGDERAAGPRRRRHPRRAVAASPTRRSPRSSAPSPRASGATPSSASPASPTIAATDEGRAAARAAIAYWQPQGRRQLRHRRTPPGSRR